MLVVIAVINSAISWYYYLRVIVAMFFAEPATGFKAPRVARSMAAAIVLALLGTLYLGILPGRVLDTLEERARSDDRAAEVKTEPQNIESIDGHFSRRVRLVKAEDIAAEITQQLADLSIPGHLSRQDSPAENAPVRASRTRKEVAG